MIETGPVELAVSCMSISQSDGRLGTRVVLRRAVGRTAYHGARRPHLTSRST
jgi:hypothetical protein